MLPQELCPSRRELNKSRSESLSFGERRGDGSASEVAAGEAKRGRGGPRRDNNIEPRPTASSHRSSSCIHKETHKKTVGQGKRNY